MRENYAKLIPHLTLAFQKLLLVVPIVFQVIALVAVLKPINTPWGEEWSVENPIPLLIDLFMIPFVILAQLFQIVVVGIAYIIGQLVYQNDAKDHDETLSGYRRLWGTFMVLGGPIVQTVYYLFKVLPRRVPKPNAN